MPGLDPDRLVFLDETWASTEHDPRATAAAASGERLVDAGAARPLEDDHVRRGAAGRRPDRPDGRRRGDQRRAVRGLRPAAAGADAAARRRGGDGQPGRPQAGRACAQAIEGAGARLLYLPPYSPDLNPIEQAFAKLKALLRKAGERTVEGLWRLLGRLLDEFAPGECRNYLRHCGYTA